MYKRQAQALVLIGVGGSNKAARALVTALEPEGIPIVYAGNTLSPHSMRQVIGQLEGKSFYINVIAKNFETLEPGVAFRTLRAVLEGRYGGGAAKRILVTGTPGSRLQEMAGENGYDFLTFPDNIGGRYSALCEMCIRDSCMPAAIRGTSRPSTSGCFPPRECRSNS